MSIEPTALSAVQAAELIAQGQLSAEDLTRACLARIDEREPVVQAWTFLDQEYALKQARAADQARRRHFRRCPGRGKAGRRTETRR